MTVTVVTLGAVPLGAMVAVPLICTGLTLRLLPAGHLTARFAGTGMIFSGWFVFGLVMAALHYWLLTAGDALLAVCWLVVAVRMARDARHYQATGEGKSGEPLLRH